MPASVQAAPARYTASVRAWGPVLTYSLSTADVTVHPPGIAGSGNLTYARRTLLLSDFTQRELSFPWLEFALSSCVKESSLAATVCEPVLGQNVAAAVKLLPALLVGELNAPSVTPVVAATASTRAAMASTRVFRWALTGSAPPT